MTAILESFSFLPKHATKKIATLTYFVNFSLETNHGGDRDLSVSTTHKLLRCISFATLIVFGYSKYNENELKGAIGNIILFLTNCSEAVALVFVFLFGVWFASKIFLTQFC